MRSSLPARMRLSQWREKAERLAEIGFAKKFGRPIVALKSWPEIAGLERATTPREAVDLAMKLAARPRG